MERTVRRMVVAAVAAAGLVAALAGPGVAGGPVIPDLKIKRHNVSMYSGGGTGEGCHDDPAEVTVNRKVGKTAIFDVKVKNAGSSGEITVAELSTTVMGDPIFKAKYFKGSANITTAVQDAGKVFTIGAGQQKQLRLEIKIKGGSDPGDSLNLCIDGSPNDDSVHAIVNVV